MGLIVPFEDFRDERMELVIAAPHYTLLWTIIGLTGGPVIPFVAGVSSANSPKIHVCASLGLVARTLIIRCHCVAEVWSEEYGKWILIDAGGF